MKLLISHLFSIVGKSAAFNIAKKYSNVNTNSDNSHKRAVYLNFEILQMRQPVLRYTRFLKVVLLKIQNFWVVMLFQLVHFEVSSKAT